MAPNEIAAHLRPLGLLPQRVLVSLRNSQKNDDEKAQEIVDAVLFQVKKDSSVFYSFIEALNSAGPWTKSTVSELQKEFNSYSVRASTTSSDAASTCEQSLFVKLIMYFRRSFRIAWAVIHTTYTLSGPKVVPI